MTYQQPLLRKQRQAAKKANQFLQNLSETSPEKEKKTRNDDDDLFVDIHGQRNKTYNNTSDTSRHRIFVADNEIAIIISNYKANTKSVADGEESVFQRFGIRSDKSKISTYEWKYR